MTDEEIDTLVQKIATEQGATSAKEYGAVMKAVMAQTSGRAEGNRVAEAVKRVLRG